MLLNREETDAIDARVASVEAATGVEVVAAVIGKSDAYTELPWKAFALGASLAALVTVWADEWWPDWITMHAALKFAVAVLACGGASALAAVFIPGYARSFLRASRRDVEVRQYAQALFLERELFRARGRTGLLLLVSSFERKVEVLPDTGFRGRVNASDWHDVVARMTPRLREGRAADALLEGLGDLQDVLVRNGFRGGANPVNELPDRPIDEPGPLS